jgi:hypothetical protein
MFQNVTQGLDLLRAFEMTYAMEMDMKSRIWNMRSLYRPGSLKTAAYIEWKHRSNGTTMALNQQTIIPFSMEKGITMINYAQDFLYIRDSNQQLREQSLLVTTCHIWYYVIFVRFQYSIRDRTYFQNKNRE